jgi:hypothetical protein
VSIESLMSQTAQPLSLSAALQACDAWVVFHTISVSPDAAGYGPAMLGLAIEFNEESGALVRDIFPQSDFVKESDGRIEYRSHIGFEGELRPIPTPELAAVAGEATGVSAKATARVERNAVAEMQFVVRSPRIVVSGRFSSRTEWLFYKHAKVGFSLLGDFVVAHSVYVRKGVRELPLLAQVRAGVPSLIPGVTVPLKSSEWVRQVIALRDSESVPWLRTAIEPNVSAIAGTI